MSDIYRDAAASLAARVADLMDRLTLAEKVTLLAGASAFALPAIERLGIPSLRLTDGPTGCTITADARIGRQFQCNIYAYVAHDCVIGDYVTFAPRVSLNGNVVVEDHVYVGTGAVIRQGTSDKPLVLGRGCVIGMGAVVTRDVGPGVTVVGNPARPLEAK